MGLYEVSKFKRERKFCKYNSGLYHKTSRSKSLIAVNFGVIGVQGIIGTIWNG